MVSTAAFISWLGILAGLFALIVPGVLLFLRWSVVAQAAALGGKSWREALERSKLLTGGGHYPHIFALFFLVALIGVAPDALLFVAFGSHTTVASFLLRTAVSIVMSSFTALAVALLYYDLSARFTLDGGRPLVEPGPSADVSLSERTVEPTGPPLDPHSYYDENRPRGWYIDPQFPRTMQYWAADGTPNWSKRSSRTPRKTLEEWFEYQKREKEPEQRV